MTEQRILEIVYEKMAHRPKIIKMFEKCYSDTIENTIRFGEDGTVFMLTGDIPAMWLRDSTNQLRPYLITASENERIKRIIEGVMKKAVFVYYERPLCKRF